MFDDEKPGPDEGAPPGPPPGDGPSIPQAETAISPTAINQASAALAGAIDKLSDGKVPPPQVEPPPEPVMQLPAPLYAGLKVIEQFGEQQGWPPDMRVDCEAAARNEEGLERATEVLDKLASSGAPKAEAKPAPKEPEAPPKPGRKSSEFVGKQAPPAAEGEEEPEDKPKKKPFPPKGPGRRSAEFMQKG